MKESNVHVVDQILYFEMFLLQRRLADSLGFQ